MIYHTNIAISIRLKLKWGKKSESTEEETNNHLNDPREGPAPTIRFRERNNGHRHHNSVDITQRQRQSNHGRHLHPLRRDELQKPTRRRRNRPAAGAAAIRRPGLHGRDTTPTGGRPRPRPNADEPSPAPLAGNRDARRPALAGKRRDGGGEGKGWG